MKTNTLRKILFRNLSKRYLPRRIKIITNISKGDMVRNCCWICDGWVEIEINWKNRFSGSRDKGKPLFVHLSFENYKPRFLGLLGADGLIGKIQFLLIFIYFICYL